MRDASSPAISPGELWKPQIGEELVRFLEALHPDAQRRVRDEALAVLARTVPPGTSGRRAGLVLGQVQSGKTTSFTAVAAGAKDNEIGLVIVVAGTSTPLLEQTRRRLRRDLDLESMDAYRRWVHIESPTPETPQARDLHDALRDWLEPDATGDKAAVLITVMKQHVHLQNLVEVLQTMPELLERVTAIVVDDEADQATPNLAREPGEESATYGRLRRVRATLPSHTLLQYTATPQATLLVSIADEISPDFTCVLEPGSGYTGGKEFFVDRATDFIRHIPEADLLLIDGETQPPTTLGHAFAVFILGVAAGLMASAREPTQRSMLVHPSQQTLPQEQFIDWLSAMKDHYATTLELPDSDPDRKDLLERTLRPAHDDLSRTVDDLPDLEELVKRIPSALRKTSIERVNASRGRPPEIKWPNAYAWILVGGTLLDRGFTVEGLTVTYMPRGLGVGNADTVQQRGRFFGYKASYAGYCRAWLDADVQQAFADYVAHEEQMRTTLRELSLSGRSLKDWKREFLLDRNLQPTRKAVIRLPLLRPRFANQWFRQSSFENADAELLDENRRTVATFLDGLILTQDPADRGALTDMQVHQSADVPLGRVLEDLLENYVMTDDEAARFTAARLVLELASEASDEGCRIVLMSSGVRRHRGVNEDRRIINLHQGSNDTTGYPGDRLIRADEAVTIQIHCVDLTADNGTDDGDPSRVLVQDARALAIWIPDRVAQSVIVEA